MRPVSNSHMDIEEIIVQLFFKKSVNFMDLSFFAFLL